jgi:hypothetical protein
MGNEDEAIAFLSLLVKNLADLGEEAIDIKNLGQPFEVGG